MTTDWDGRTDVEDWHREFDVTKMTWAVTLAFKTGTAHFAALNGAEFGIAEAFLSRLLTLIVLSRVSNNVITRCAGVSARHLP